MDPGDTLPFRSDLLDQPAEQGGVLVNATTAALTITLPDGTTITPTIANPPAVTGKYLYDLVATIPGRYQGQWLFTMATGKTTSYVETFDVGSSLVTVDEAIAHLRAAGIVTSAADLDQLQWLCFVASDAVERDLGRVIMRRTVVETYDGARTVILLRSTPVISITSVVESGSTLSAADYLLDPAAGILYRGASGYPRSFPYGRQNIVVTYVAGYTDPPRIARKVALNAVQGMWQASQQASHPLLDESGESVFAAVGDLTPLERRAYESLSSPSIA
jgi:hypothetical protein